MKKKIVLMVMATVLALSVAACGKNDATNDTPDSTIESGTDTTSESNVEDTTDATDDNATTGGDTVTGDATVNSAVDVLANVWETYGEEETFFAMGGDMANAVDGAPGLFSMDDAEALTYSLLIPTDSIALVDETASLMHAMNANTFTGAAFHVSDAANVETLVNDLKENITTNEWMCGFPDTLLIYTVNGEYVVSAFGNVDAMATFKEKLEAVYGADAVLVVEENLI